MIDSILKKMDLKCYNSNPSKYRSIFLETCYIRFPQLEQKSKLINTKYPLFCLIFWMKAFLVLEYSLQNLILKKNIKNNKVNSLSFKKIFHSDKNFIKEK
jgi:hypothetical protein